MKKMRYEEEYRLQKEQRRRLDERRRRRRKRRQREMILRLCACAAGILLVIATAAGILRSVGAKHGKLEKEAEAMASEGKYIAERPDFTVDLLDINEYSRPGTALPRVNGIVIHYTANPGTTAAQNRSYFQNLKDTKETYASSHFVVGIDGEIIQCIPCNEVAYASNDRNEDTVSIEGCIPDESGKFLDETYQALIKLTAWLMGRYDLSVEAVIRHYDVTGKSCPKYFVENEAAWEQFRQDLMTYIDTYGIAKNPEIK